MTAGVPPVLPAVAPVSLVDGAEAPEVGDGAFERALELAVAAAQQVPVPAPPVAMPLTPVSAQARPDAPASPEVPTGDLFADAEDEALSGRSPGRPGTVGASDVLPPSGNDTRAAHPAEPLATLPMRVGDRVLPDAVTQRAAAVLTAVRAAIPVQDPVTQSERLAVSMPPVGVSEGASTGPAAEPQMPMVEGIPGMRARVIARAFGAAWSLPSRALPALEPHVPLPQPHSAAVDPAPVAATAALPRARALVDPRPRLVESSPPPAAPDLITEPQVGGFTSASRNEVTVRPDSRPHAPQPAPGTPASGVPAVATQPALRTPKVAAGVAEAKPRHPEAAAAAPGGGMREARDVASAASRGAAAEVAPQQTASTMAGEAGDPSMPHREPHTPAPAAPATAPVPVVTAAVASSPDAPRIEPHASAHATTAAPMIGERPEVAPRAADRVTLRFDGEHGLEGRLRISVRGERVHASLLSADAQTLERLSAGMPALRQALEDQGFAEARVVLQDLRAPGNASETRSESRSGEDRRQGESSRRQQGSDEHGGEAGPDGQRRDRSTRDGRRGR